MPTSTDVHLDSARTALDIARREARDTDSPTGLIYAVIAVAETGYALVEHLRHGTVGVMDCGRA